MSGRTTIGCSTPISVIDATSSSSSPSSKTVRGCQVFGRIDLTGTSAKWAPGTGTSSVSREAESSSSATAATSGPSSAPPSPAPVSSAGTSVAAAGPSVSDTVILEITPYADSGSSSTTDCASLSASPSSGRMFVSSKASILVNPAPVAASSPAPGSDGSMREPSAPVRMLNRPPAIAESHDAVRALVRG